MRREAFMLGENGDARFCIVTRPEGEARGAILHVHPFAEEMNKSRRMTAMAAREFAARGWSVLQIDLAGCGDSAGDFAEATWQRWLDDIERARAWLDRNCAGPFVVWSLRAGALLVADWIEASSRQAAVLMWQPVTSGRQHLAQFMRLVATGEMLADADARAALTAVRADLAAGRAVEIAGYMLNAGIARDLERSTLRLPERYDAAVALLEVAPGEERRLSPASAALLEQWRAAGVAVTSHAVGGAPFWQTQEIEVAPELTAATCGWLDRLAA